MKALLCTKPSRFAGWLAITIGFSAGHAAQAYELDPWVQTQSSASTQAMLVNVSPSYAAPGAVVASPSFDPNYRYHWVRDAALTMDTVIGLYEQAQAQADRDRYAQLLAQYIDFSRRNQLTPNPSGEADGMGLGEPKFNLDGSAYADPWGRPQNDGPALRASTLIRWAKILLSQGRESYVREKLYNGVLPAKTVIKADLEFVSHHWQETSYDLWEEVRGHHFYTRMVQRRALIEGAALADRLGDGGAASWYRAQAQLLEREIDRHWDAGRGYIAVTLDRDGGLDYKSSGLDAGVVLGALHGAVRDIQDSFYAVTGDRVLATAQRLETVFKSIYGINSRVADWDGQPMGPGIGRYPEDRYSGTTTSNQGNPWFLATDALAELYYRAASRWAGEGRILVTPTNATLFQGLRAFARVGNLQPGEVVDSADPRFLVLLRALRDNGDRFLRRTKFHADPGGAISEQMNRDSGYMQSAAQLTWSHASLLTAAWARAQ